MQPGFLVDEHLDIRELLWNKLLLTYIYNKKKGYNPRFKSNRRTIVALRSTNVSCAVSLVVMCICVYCINVSITDNQELEVVTNE